MGLTHTEYQRRWRLEFKEKHGVSYSAAYRRRNPEQAKKHRDAERARWAKNPAQRLQHRQHNTRHRKKVKDAAFRAYGGYRCKCCGESHVEFLSIDHVRNDGAAHRRVIGGSGAVLYRWLARHGYPTGFQVLCMNCNWAKGIFGRCPHKKRQRTGA